MVNYASKAVNRRVHRGTLGHHAGGPRRPELADAPAVFTLNGPVALVTLDRPETGNLITPGISRSVKCACAQADQDPSVRVLVITGAGGHFSRGRDRPAPEPARIPGSGFDDWLAPRRVAAAVASVKVPTIAAIDGDALDHGLELALACDLRIASQDARLGITDLLSGVLPWDGGTQRLPRLVGVPRALDMLLTGRLLTAQEAAAIGLIGRVATPGGALAAALEMAQAIAQAGPIAVRYTKEAAYQGADLSLEQGLALEADLSFILQGTADRREGLQAFRQKRKPRFTGE